MSYMIAAIFYNLKTNPRNSKFAREISAILGKSSIISLVNPLPKDYRKIDVAFAVGGDGTVLHAANLIAGCSIPLLGINYGHRGYLCGTGKDDLQAAIDRIIAQDYSIEEKTRIQAKITKRQNAIRTLEGLNEISIGGINRTVHLEVEIETTDSTLKTEVQGDGIVVATRTGSTAYNINAGGSMLLIEAFSVVASNAFFISEDLLPVTRSIVIPSDAHIKVRDISQKQANLPFVIADGQESVKLSTGDTIRIQKAKDTNLFIRF